jgi:hypothetical protein
MKNRVFISYASQDRDFVERLKPELTKILSKKSQPLEIFDVQSHAKVGSDVRKAIKTAMDRAGTVVVVSSPDGDASQWVNYEAGLADALGKKLVIVGRRGMRKSALVNRFANTAKVIELDNVS